MVPGQVTINLLSGTYRIVASLETGLLVRGNYVHGGGGTGIYTDYGARFATVRDNVVLPGHQGGCSVFPIEHLLSEGNFWTEEPEWYCGDAVDFVSRGNQVVDHAGCAGSAACAAIIQGAGLQPEFRDLLERW